jgi:hypothetical protein
LNHGEAIGNICLDLTHLNRRGVRLTGAIFIAFSMLARHENHWDELQYRRAT